MRFDACRFSDSSANGVHLEELDSCRDGSASTVASVYFDLQMEKLGGAERLALLTSFTGKDTNHFRQPVFRQKYF